MKAVSIKGRKSGFQSLSVDIKMKSMTGRPDKVKLLPAYPMAAAARLIGSNPSTLRTWFRGRSGATKKYAAKLPTQSKSGEPISFIDLVEAHVFRLIRQRYHIPRKHIKAATEYLASIKGNLTYLAHQDFYVDSAHLMLKINDMLVSLSERGQLVDKEILEDGLKQLNYGSDGYASEFFPAPKSGPPEQRSFVISPTRNFGRLCLLRSGVSMDAIAMRFIKGEKIADIAADYDATIEEIEGAIRWHEWLAA